MPKFRKKPLIVEAEQFLVAEKPWPEDVVYDEDLRPEPPKKRCYQLQDEEGYQICALSDGDWIVTGIRGERYPLKQDVFEESYDLVEE